MVKNRPLQSALTHGTTILGVSVGTSPIYIALITSTYDTKDVMTNVITSTAKILTAIDDISDWYITMAPAILALLPPLVVVVVMQRHFVKGLIETDK